MSFKGLDKVPYRIAKQAQQYMHGKRVEERQRVNGQPNGYRAVVDNAGKWDEANKSLLTEMIKWEQGELDQEATVSLFQELVDTGMAWSLQGMYGREAMSLINSGLVTRPEDAQ